MSIRQKRKTAELIPATEISAVVMAKIKGITLRFFEM
jgi:hypothetical protein